MLDRFKQESRIIIERLRQGILQVFTANVINKIIVMVSNMVITRVLTKPEYGVWSFVLNIYSYASLITGLGLATGAFQFGAENRGNEKEFSFYKYCLSIGLIANSIISLGFICSSFLIDFSIEGSTPYIRAYVPIILLEYTVEILLTILRCQSRMTEYARVLNINTILVAGLTCLGALCGVGGVIVGKYVAAILSISYLVYIARPEIKKIISSNWVSGQQKKELWHYSFFTGLSSTLNRMLYLIDVSMIASLIKSATDVANYKVATLIPNSLTFIPSSVIIVVLPNIIAHNRDFTWLRKNVKKTYLCLFVLNVIIGIVLTAFAPLIINILSGSQYADSIKPFRILVFGYVIAGTFRYLSTNILAGLRRVVFNLIISLLTGIADIILNYFLIRIWGMNGAAYATLSVEILASVISFGFVVFVLKNKKEVKRND